MASRLPCTVVLVIAVRAAGLTPQRLPNLAPRAELRWDDGWQLKVDPCLCGNRHDAFLDEDLLQESEMERIACGINTPLECLEAAGQLGFRIDRLHNCGIRIEGEHAVVNNSRFPIALPSFGHDCLEGPVSAGVDMPLRWGKHGVRRWTRPDGDVKHITFGDVLRQDPEYCAWVHDFVFRSDSSIARNGAYFQQWLRMLTEDDIVDYCLHEEELVLQVENHTERAVGNVVGTSWHRLPGKSWKKYWLERTGREWPKTCCFEECDNEARVGGHVHIEEYKSRVQFILPICNSCNSAVQNDFRREQVPQSPASRIVYPRKVKLRSWVAEAPST
jgi:hypothetical protein